MKGTDTGWHDDATRLLKILVEIPSPSGAERAASEALAAWMKSYGFDANIDDAGNCIGSRGQGPNVIVLLGHIDTVSSQLPVILENGWLAGRGTVDAKGPLAAFAMAATLVSIPNDWRVVVIGAVEEEAPTSKGARHILESHATPHCCIIGEPSQWDRITIAYKGLFLAQIQLEVGQSHASGQHLLPAECGVEFWNAIVAYCGAYNSRHPKLFEQLIPSLRTINSRPGGAIGIIDLELGFRLPRDLDTDELQNKLREIAAGLPIRELRIEVLNDIKAVIRSKNTALVRALLGAIRQWEGSPRFVYKTGTSDMNLVAPHWDCPIVAYGAGDSSLDHAPGERINLDEFLKSVEILRSALETLMTASALPTESTGSEGAFFGSNPNT